MTTALIYDPIFLEHITPEKHPDKPERLQMAMDVLPMVLYSLRHAPLQRMSWLLCMSATTSRR